MFTVSCDYRFTVQQENIAQGTKINAKIPTKALKRLKEGVKRLLGEKADAFQHVNARTHSSVGTSAAIEIIGLEVAPHSFHSPD